jgi:hypothetical protein
VSSESWGRCQAARTTPGMSGAEGSAATLMVAGGGQGEDGGKGVVGPTFIGEGSPVTLPSCRRCDRSPASSAGARMAEMPPSDRRSMARAWPVRRGHDGVRPERTPRRLVARASGEAHASSGVRPGAPLGADAEGRRHVAGDVRRVGARHRGSSAPAHFILPSTTSNSNYSKNLNKS